MRLARITHRGESREAPADGWQAILDEMIARLGPWIGEGPERTRVELVETVEPEPGVDTLATVAAAAAAKGLSDWGATKVDPEAVARIEAIDAALQAEGLGAINQGAQFYARGTRMAEDGYRTQEGRRIAFDKQASVLDAIEEGRTTVQAERRKDVKLTAGDLGQGLSMNGALKWQGLKVREQAIRGLLSRLESPALRYVLGLRERIVQAALALKGRESVFSGLDRQVVERGMAADKESLLDCLQRECRRFPGEPVMLRVREGLGDVFTTVSQDYTNADFDQQATLLARQFSSEGKGQAKGRFRYDPTSTRWELQAEVWTPTPTADQAVGEPYRGYASLKGGDAGLTSIWPGGGMEILRCLNASTFMQDFLSQGRRTHRGDVLRDVARMVQQATKGIDILVNAWGQARATTVEQPKDKHEALIPIEQAIPGFYRAMLTTRQGVLVGRLPGRTEGHVQGLARAYVSERRDPSEITRADLAQGYTKYLQTQPEPVRLDAEGAIGRWIVNPRGEPLTYVAA